jgi:predicted transcriptional regulator
VRICEKKSTSLGPPRKCYEGTGQFSIRIDLGPSDFETRLLPRLEKQTREASGVAQFEDLFLESREIADAGRRLRAYKDLVSKLNDEVEELERRRGSLIALKQDILREASTEISGMSQDYHERRLLYMLTERPGMPLDEIARMMNLQREVLARMYRQLLEDTL